MSKDKTIAEEIWQKEGSTTNPEAAATEETEEKTGVVPFLGGLATEKIVRFETSGEPYFLVTPDIAVAEGSTPTPQKVYIENLVGLTEARWNTFNRRSNPVVSKTLKADAAKRRAIQILANQGLSADEIATLLATAKHDDSTATATAA